MTERERFFFASGTNRKDVVRFDLTLSASEQDRVLA